MTSRVLSAGNWIEAARTRGKKESAMPKVWFAFDIWPCSCIALPACTETSCAVYIAAGWPFINNDSYAKPDGIRRKALFEKYVYREFNNQ